MLLKSNIIKLSSIFMREKNLMGTDGWWLGVWKLEIGFLPLLLVWPHIQE